MASTQNSTLFFFLCPMTFVEKQLTKNSESKNQVLTLIWMAFLGMNFVMGKGRGKINPSLSPLSKTYQSFVKFWQVSTHLYVVSENITFSTRTSLIFLISAFFFCKKSALFGKNGTFLQSNSMRVVLEIFTFHFQFL